MAVELLNGSANSIIAIGTLVTAFATLFVAIYTMGLWRETYKQRKAMQKPILVASGLPKDVDNSKSVFVGNFEYPCFDSFENSKLYYLGIKNIGQGHALKVRVDSLLANGKSIAIGIPPACPVQANETVALIVRFGYNEPVSDLGHTPYQVVISYCDTQGNEYVLNLNLWFPWADKEEAIQAVVLGSLDFRKEFDAIIGPLFRYAESKGHFELQRLKSRGNNEKATQEKD